jgi:predicted kinase
MVGLPGSGKTTRARQIETEHGALRLTPDDWMMPLFGEPEPGGKRDVMEGRFVWLALRSLRLGMNVVLDFGVWGRQERMALRSLAGSVGAVCELIYLEIDPDEQKRRIDERFRSNPDTTFEMGADDVARSNRLFQVPEGAELEPGEIDPPPPGYSNWRAWVSERWPTALPDDPAL